MTAKIWAGYSLDLITNTVYCYSSSGNISCCLSVFISGASAQKQIQNVKKHICQHFVMKTSVDVDTKLWQFSLGSKCQLVILVYFTMALFQLCQLFQRISGSYYQSMISWKTQHPSFGSSKVSQKTLTFCSL